MSCKTFAVHLIKHKKQAQIRVDDGSTARSLARVSRYVREVAKPFFYQSLVIAGLGQLSELASRLEHTPHHLRRIRHLFLSDWTHDQANQRVVSTSDADMDRYDLENATAARILTLAAPTLETLTVISSCPFTSTPLIGHIFSTPLPHLLELALSGYYRSPTREGALEAACPSLTHLRISGLASAASFADELREAATPADGPPSKFPARFPPRLRELVLEPRQLLLPPVKRSPFHLMHEKMLNSLRELAESPSGRGVRVVVLEKERAEDLYHEMLGRWLERLI
ncbi:hypothetical protein A0H81_06779 [Grifola frondosa]|uniref:F-box domain-containing protein n=1 Tax=Grifola frondosa TaxID=5627 RepID=A0A1C7M7X4_GRIFR|nr:hypothetical protein A0H81_06779 [Grifola frondosa]